MTANRLNINDTGIVSFNSTTGQFVSTQLSAKGDILSKNLTAYEKLSVGTDAHVIVCDSTQTTGLNYASKNSGSSVVFLESQTASTSSSLDFTASFDNSTYSYYTFTISNLIPSTNSVDLRSRFSITGGSTWVTSSGYRWDYIRLSSLSGTGSVTGNTSEAFIKFIDSVYNSAGDGMSGKILYLPVTNPTSSNQCVIYHDLTYIRNGYIYRTVGRGSLETASVVNGIRWYFSSGNISTGTIKMYGIAKS